MVAFPPAEDEEVVDAAACVSEGCGEPAYWLPVLVFKPMNYVPGMTEARAEIGLPLCHTHRLGLTLKDVLTDDGWLAICHTFQKHQAVPPDRESVQLDFKHMEWGYYS